MPIYTYKCASCKDRTSVFKKIAELDRLEMCLICESPVPMMRQVAAPMVVADYAAYSCPVTGKMIEGKRAHEENLKRHGCRVMEPGETEQFKRRRADEETAFDNKIGDTVDEFIATAPAEKREALAAAETMGITAQVTRG